MKFEFEITRQDYHDFNTFHFFKTKLRQTCIAGGFVWITTLILINSKNPPKTITFNFAFSIVYIAFYCLIIYISLQTARKAPQAEGAMLGEKVLEFNEEGICAIDKDSQSQYKWSAVKKINESKKAFYLYLDTHMAIPIPKRVFKNELERQSFGDLVQRKVSKI